ncbi:MULTISPECIES: NirD/YgiW/YdeI family stress tolerance protein [unclassified Pseudomonas]|uniref:NirD/YgiW/YdeI family stress tolerance protein n=1 Tax=unclassified Pseudomonas TaxID=196821 RepID=UPI00244B351F|nr:NirD/YgiW/YdeI family stress tolerance protein [Pseudomonas sp. GD03944]MDH1264604.1 NirD/YgiW/YdeI family stress tolerance protein [Pseudomonas sp. GD03944]HWV11020.1 NirD/YgiW/YdeI family stress tolerance protein [Pseudomonas sp.]
MKRSTLVLLFAPLFSTAVMASGYTGPGAVTQVTTVAAALDAADDTPVVLQGQIVKRLQDELYEFKDASGTIHVEIDDEDWPPQAISENATVKLTGEVDRDLMNREIDVEFVELVK